MVASQAKAENKAGKAKSLDPFGLEAFCFGGGDGIRTRVPCGGGFQDRCVYQFHHTHLICKSQGERSPDVQILQQFCCARNQHATRVLSILNRLRTAMSNSRSKSAFQTLRV